MFYSLNKLANYLNKNSFNEELLYLKKIADDTELVLNDHYADSSEVYNYGKNWFKDMQLMFQNNPNFGMDEDAFKEGFKFSDNIREYANLESANLNADWDDREDEVKQYLKDHPDFAEYLDKNKKDINNLNEMIKSIGKDPQSPKLWHDPMWKQTKELLELSGLHPRLLDEFNYRYRYSKLNIDNQAERHLPLSLYKKMLYLFSYIGKNLDKGYWFCLDHIQASNVSWFDRKKLNDLYKIIYIMTGLNKDKSRIISLCGYVDNRKSTPGVVKRSENTGAFEIEAESELFKHIIRIDENGEVRNDIQVKNYDYLKFILENKTSIYFEPPKRYELDITPSQTLINYIGYRSTTALLKSIKTKLKGMGYSVIYVSTRNGEEWLNVDNVRSEDEVEDIFLKYLKEPVDQAIKAEKERL